jgi:hypothetical protein
LLSADLVKAWHLAGLELDEVQNAYEAGGAQKKMKGVRKHSNYALRCASMLINPFMMVDRRMSCEVLGEKRESVFGILT